MPDESYRLVISGHDTNRLPISMYFRGYCLDDARVSSSFLDCCDLCWNE